MAPLSELNPHLLFVTQLMKGKGQNSRCSLQSFVDNFVKNKYNNK